MVMTKTETTLSQTADEMYAALEALGPGWWGRSDIARSMGKSRLLVSDALVLDYLIIQGRIEAERHEINAPIHDRWEYRIVK
jgi:hypothetical protein